MTIIDLMIFFFKSLFITLWTHTHIYIYIELYKSTLSPHYKKGHYYLILVKTHTHMIQYM